MSRLEQIVLNNVDIVVGALLCVISCAQPEQRPKNQL